MKRFVIISKFFISLFMLLSLHSVICSIGQFESRIIVTLSLNCVISQDSRHLPSPFSLSQRTDQKYHYTQIRTNMVKSI